MNEWTTQDYWDSVRGIAEDAVDEYPTDEEARNEYVWESVDGSQWIIYYAGHETILAESGRLEPDGSEVAATCGPNADWREMQQVAAFLAMNAEVMEAVEAILEEREEEAE